MPFRPALAPHPLFVLLPVVLWGISLVADAVYRAGLGGRWWDDAAFFALFLGLVGALLAAVPFLVDVLVRARTQPLQGPAARYVRLNLGIVALYVVNFCLRAWDPVLPAPVLLSVAGFALLAVSGWLGGELPARAARPERFAVRIETRRRPRVQSA